MKQSILSFFKIVLSSLLTVGFLVTALFLLRLNLSTGAPPTVAPVVSTTQGATTVITPSLSYGDALKTYEGVATSAIHASERSLDMMKWLVGAFLALTTVATGVAAYLYKTARDTSERAQLAEVAAQGARAAAEAAEKQLVVLSDRYLGLSQQYLELKSKTLSLDAAIQAWDRGEITQGEFIESQQWHSWHKWTCLKNETGWHELREAALDGEGLMPIIRSAVDMEWNKVRQHASAGGNQSDEDKEYERHLQFLRDAKPVKRGQG